MSHDYDDELERSTERRSRRNPHMRDSSGAYASSDREGGYANERERWERRQRQRQEAAERELDVMGDSRIYAFPKQPKRQYEPEASGSTKEPDMLDELEMGRVRASSRRRNSADYETGASDESTRSSAVRETAGSRAVRETAAAKAGAGNSHRAGTAGEEWSGRADSEAAGSQRQDAGVEENWQNAREGESGRSRRRNAASAGNGQNTRGTGQGRSQRGMRDAETGENRWDTRTTETSGGGRRSGRSEFGRSEAKKKRRRRIIAMIVAECIALVAIFSYAFMARMMSKIQRSEDFQISEIKTNDIAVDAEENMKGYWTIAIFGVDARDNAIEKSTNSDVIILCNINRDTGEIKLVSVYRDSYLNINDKGSYAKVNQAYFMGGPKQAVEALNRNLDLQIQDYMTFNWKAVANAIDVLGGVDIELSKAEFFYINSFITETVKATGIGSHQLTHAGMNHLDGVQAVAYGRLRLMDTDYARTERQRKIIAQAFEKSKKADFQTLYTLIGTVFPQVSTSIGVDDLVSNARNISKFHLGETTGFPQARGDANMGKKGAVVVPATLESNVIELHKFLFGDEAYTPSDTVKKISAKISSDTGIYKEGQFVGNVGTGGGVVQPQKTTAAATKSSDKSESKEEEGYQTVYEYDKNGKKVSKKVKMETDADGKYVKYETDADGFLVKDETISSSHASKAETDENGELKESESGNSHKNNESSTGESGIADSKVTDRPGTSSESTSASHPGSTAESSSASHPGSGTTPTSASSHPGSSTTPTSAASHPGSSTTPTSAASHPGSNTETTTSGGGSTVPTAASHPGSSTTPTSAASHPGNTSTTPTGSGNPSSAGPSGSGNSSSSAVSGMVAGPGQ
ncbi:hypothetical protein DXB18_05250 [Clostridium sp. OM02-18AC]|uniref:LCP family protein n=1 Tax=Clostridium sp. OM02-18AC TaxID=2292311 RepID=UPI000E543C1F|nr:LCP family protein [Clostridium sp. OM02-18AC]RHV67525.1 hypothetical protein DXB18_05250 [Clostridium sp. OM02-18AC]